MEDAERILGELKEFKRATLIRLDSIESEVKGLSKFYWKVIGGFSVILVLAEIINKWRG